MKAKEPSPPKETNQVLSTSHQQQEPKEPNKAQVHKQKQDQSQSREREGGGNGLRCVWSMVVNPGMQLLSKVKVLHIDFVRLRNYLIEGLLVP